MKFKECITHHICECLQEKIDSLELDISTHRADVIELERENKKLKEALKEYTCDKFHSPNEGGYWKFYGDRFLATKVLDINNKERE